MIERIWVKKFSHARGQPGHADVRVALRQRRALGRVEAAVDVALDGSCASFRDLCFHEDQPIAFALVVKLDERSHRYELEVGADGNGVPVVTRENLSSCRRTPS
jgi:hypothetical protein